MAQSILSMLSLVQLLQFIWEPPYLFIYLDFFFFYLFLK